MKKIALIIISLILVAAVVGCSSKETARKETSTPTTESKTETNSEDKNKEKEIKLEGKVVIVGSTSVTPFMEKIGDAFMEKNSAVKVDVHGVGSSAGVKASADESADIGMASRNLKSAEEEWGLGQHVLAYDGIAVVVHPSNAVGALTKDQVTAIFKGDISNWKDVGGADKEIIVVSRESGSGTRGAFEGIMNLQEKNEAGKKVSVVMAEALITNGNGVVRSSIATKEEAIGYISLGYLDDTVLGIEIDGVAPTIENVLNDSYKVSRPFLLLTKGELSEATEALLEFALSDEGQELVSDKLIPINK